MAVEGKTYTLYGDGTETERYYAKIRQLAEEFLQHCPDEKRLLFLVQKAAENRFFENMRIKGSDRRLIPLIKGALKESLSVYTKNVEPHLKNLPITKRLDSTLTTKEEQYHLYMLEIELVNRIYREQFKNSEYKFALIAHCLRDFRPECRSERGDVEAVCRGCTNDCFIHLGNILLRKYGINPYISVEMDQERLFKKLKGEHSSIGALGIACIPELAMGMRLCIRLGIPPLGIPLDANRCARWMSWAHESSFNLEQLEHLLK